jgi:hypothetical protein
MHEFMTESVWGRTAAVLVVMAPLVVGTAAVIYAVLTRLLRPRRRP